MAVLMKVLLCGLLCLGGAALQAGDESLGRGVPSDSVLYLRYRLDPQSEVGGALGRMARQARFGATARRLAALGLEALGAQPGLEALGAQPGSEGRDGIRRTMRVAHWLGLLDGVPWSRLVSRELVLAARLEGERREFLLLFRLDEDLDRALEGLRKLAYAACALTPALEISESWDERVKSLILYDLLQDEGLAFGGRDGVMLLATSPRLLRRSLQLLAGEGSDIGYHDTPKRRERWSVLDGAPDLLPEPADLLELHVEAARLLPDVPSVGDVETLSLGAWTRDSELHYRACAEFGRTELGRLRALLLERPAVDLDSLRIPAEAASCEVSSGTDLQGLLGFALEVSLQVAPQSRSVLEVLRRWGFGPGDGSRDPPEGSTPPRLWRALGWLSGPRVIGGNADGLGGWIEAGEARGKDDVPELLKGWEPLLRSGGLEIAVTSRALVWGTSEAWLRAGERALSGEASRSWDLPIPSPRPPGDLLEARSVDRTFLARGLGTVATLLRGLAESPGGAPEGARGALRAFAGALSGLEASLPVERVLSATARDGDRLRGGGILRFLRKEEGSEERQF